MSSPPSIRTITAEELFRIATLVCTDKQITILELLASGHSQRSAARHLNLAHSTITGHVAAVYRRINQHLEKEAA